MSISPPETPRATIFFDGQNLFKTAKRIFGYTWPNYDVRRLAQTVCQTKGWNLVETRFYTGVPEVSENPAWNGFWNAKLLSMKRQGITTFSRPLRYRDNEITCPDGQKYRARIPSEKGVDIRIALDVIRLAYDNSYDVALIFSQDQDFSEVARELREIAREQTRWIKIACAFPYTSTMRNSRGINGTDWIPLDKTTYDTCLDPRDYRQ